MVLHALGQGVPGCKAGRQLVQYLAEQSCLPTEQTPITTRTQLVETLAGRHGRAAGGGQRPGAGVFHPGYAGPQRDQPQRGRQHARPTGCIYRAPAQ